MWTLRLTSVYFRAAAASACAMGRAFSGIGSTAAPAARAQSRLTSASTPRGIAVDARSAPIERGLNTAMHCCTAAFKEAWVANSWSPRSTIFRSTISSAIPPA